MPGLTDLFTDGIIAVLHLVKGEGLELSGINLSGSIQNLFVRDHIDDPAENAQSIGLGLHFNHLALQRERIFRNDGRVHPAALDSVKSDTLKFVRHFVGGGNSEKI